jgi:uncharacterized protein YndB with AHSA1/START domain
MSDLTFPSELDVALTRVYDAPAALVFDVLWEPEHLRRTIAPYGEEVTVLEVDLKVGGDYRFVFVPPDGKECSFRGTFLEVDRPRRTAQTWHFDGWPDADAVESFDLAEVDGGTRLTWTLAFRDRAGRDRMTAYDGIEANFDHVGALLEELQGR